MWLAVLFGSLAASAAFGFYVPTCPENGSPVCVTNGRAYLYFENKCKLDAYIYKQRLYDKPLPIRTDIENCLSYCYEIVCPAIFQPVCAQQVPVGPARTVPNPCHVDRLICETKQHWKVIREGPCLSPQDYQAVDLIPTYASNSVADQDQIPTTSLNTASGQFYEAPDPTPIAQNTAGQSQVLTTTLAKGQDQDFEVATSTPYQGPVLKSSTDSGQGDDFPTSALAPAPVTYNAAQLSSTDGQSQNYTTSTTSVTDQSPVAALSSDANEDQGSEAPATSPYP